MIIDYININEMVGKTFTQVEKIDEDMIEFRMENGDKYRMFHEQDCCESVYIEDICGELEYLVGTPILMAEEVESDKSEPLTEYDESYTWTFYKLATIKGYVTIRWYGSSNGYYSESVNIELKTKDKQQ